MDNKTDQRVNESEIVMLRWTCIVTMDAKIRNEIIRDGVGITQIVNKMRKNRLRYFLVML